MQKMKEWLDAEMIKGIKNGIIVVAGVVVGILAFIYKNKK